MSKKTMKILSVLLMAIMMITFSTSVFAITPMNMTGNENVQGSNEIATAGNAIIGVLRTVGIVISVVVLIIIGLKYMMGSAEEKAEYKKTLLPYLVGALFIFAASVLANVVFEFMSGIGRAS